jgi:NurA-like 5'-3' nuclease
MLAVATEKGYSGRTQLAETVSKSVSAVPLRCKECDRLWAEYTKASFEHFHVENKLKMAAVEGDVEAVVRLTRGIEEARHCRDHMREAMRKHEASHPQANPAMDEDGILTCLWVIAQKNR